MKTILAWHFLPEDGRMRYGDNRNPRVGVTYRAKGELDPCENGMHASECIMDALGFAPGPILCRVELIGPMIRQEDKICARGRRIITMADVSETLHRFAVSCAMRALRQVGDPDPRSVEVCKVKLRWLDGKATDEELAAAWADAWEASRTASLAASREAAWAAARTAAWEAARTADWAAARTADWEAARAAAVWDDASWDAQKKSLTRLLKKHHPELMVRDE